jgi:hypothetical protein
MPFKDPEKARASKRAYWEKNKERHRALVRENQRKRFAAMTPEQRRAVWAESKAKQRLNMESRERINAAHKKWRNGEKGAAYRARPEIKKMQCEASDRWREKNWDKVVDYARRKRATDPMFRLQSALRGRVLSFLKGHNKSKKTMEYVGCTVEQLRAHIESQFLPHMHWGNQGKGRGKWQVDHIHPLSKVDPTDEEQVKRALHWSNLRPMWAIANIKKGNKVKSVPVQIPLLAI